VVRYRYWGALRLFLAILVVCQHFGVNLADGVIRTLAIEWLPGSAAVLVFFTLSGFIITEASTKVYKGRPAVFLLNRFLRVIVPYWVALSCMLIMLFLFGLHGALRSPSGAPWGDLPIRPFTIAQNYLALWPGFLWPLSNYQIDPDILVVFWSVRFELVFYLFVAVTTWFGGIRSFVWLLVCIVLLGIFFASAQSSAPKTYDGFSASIATFFALGMTAYLIGCVRVPRMAETVLLLVAFGMAISTVSAFDPIASPRPLVNQMTLVAVLILSAVGLKDIEWPRLKATDRLLGDLSYSLYLTHIIVQTAALNLGLCPSPSTFFCCFTVAVLVSYGFHLAVDPLLAGIRDRLRGCSVDSHADKTFSAGG
jgi:peptidoglycan/LPS O-acetylase OafA/YrhL